MGMRTSLPSPPHHDGVDVVDLYLLVSFLCGQLHSKGLFPKDYLYRSEGPVTYYDITSLA